MMGLPDADVRPQARVPIHDTDPREGAPESPLNDYMDYIGGAGFQRGPVLTSGALGPAFLTWGQQDFRDMRRRYGEGDPSMGNYSLNQIHFDKENGNVSVAQLDVGPSGWYGTPGQSGGSTERQTGQ